MVGAQERKRLEAVAELVVDAVPEQGVQGVRVGEEGVHGTVEDDELPAARGGLGVRDRCVRGVSEHLAGGRIERRKGPVGRDQPATDQQATVHEQLLRIIRARGLRVLDGCRRFGVRLLHSAPLRKWHSQIRQGYILIKRTQWFCEI